MKKTSIQDIAAALALSRNTVSKALSGDDIVAPETRKLVVKTALEMGYPRIKITFPENYEDTGFRQKTNSILLLCNRYPSGFWSRIIMGISDIINANRDNLMLHIVSHDEEEYCTIPSELKDSVDGVIFLSVFNKNYTDAICSCNKPVVFLDAPVDYSIYLKKGDIIVTEGYSTTKEITLKLISQGLQRLCFIGDITYCKSIRDRYDGFMAALELARIKPDRRIHFTSHTINNYYNIDEVMSAINKLDYIPDAIVCANDDIAKDVYQIFRRSNIKIPQDIAVTGFDNSEAAELLEPALTTVAVHNHTIGTRLAEALYSRFRTPDKPYEMVNISSDVMFRASSEKYMDTQKLGY
ncbi:MAG: LacI family DNA-binding transcriptional regulator [Lachnospiraceae bacterium]|nr:LacI family DNA-binding transcriptional regulator [Lachnospiraceae bacterium]